MSAPPSLERRKKKEAEYGMDCLGKLERRYMPSQDHVNVSQGKLENIKTKIISSRCKLGTDLICIHASE